MQTSEAIEYVNRTLNVWPGWELEARDHSHRFEDTICLYFTLTEARDTNREFFPKHNVRVPGGAKASWPIYVGDITDRAELAYRVTRAAVENFTHEWRELLREHPDGYAPLHPHRADGIRAWSRYSGGDPVNDYLFGLS